MNPEFPIYIISKGRADSRLTSKALESMNVPYFIVVEDIEYLEYAEVIDPEKILILPNRYLINYDTFDKEGIQKSVGPGAARNFCWDHSIKNGYSHHWVMDDNLDGFIRLNRNERHPVDSGTIFKCAEDFVLRYNNIAISGFEYRFFAGGSRRKKPPFRLNTRIYSCLLIRNDISYRWRGRYNEDTDLSLRVLKDGWCTVLFQAFLCNKIKTQQLKGGNTAEFYAHEGTKNKSAMLVDMHPDLSREAVRYGRDHHHVNYSVFKQKLNKKSVLQKYNKVNNYGMVLKKLLAGKKHKMATAVNDLKCKL